MAGALGMDRPTAVGHSMGGFVTMVPAAVHGDDIAVDGRRRIGLVAAVSSELVGVAHLDLPGGGTGEVAVLAEDAHQRRGIDATLLRRCVHAVAVRDVGVLSAVCLAENIAFPHLDDT